MEYSESLSKIAIRAHNLILTIGRDTCNAHIVHQKNNLLNVLHLSEVRAKRVMKDGKNVEKLKNISKLLKNIINDITKRNINLYTEMLKDLSSLLNNVSK